MTSADAEENAADPLSPSQNDGLKTKVETWLNNEGFPAEYAAAKAFRDAGFGRVWQGLHVAGREIDVVATQLANGSTCNPLISVEYVVEVKSTKQPWVAFSSPHVRMHPSAMIAQSVSNELGFASLYVVAGSEVLTSTDLFSGQPPFCFGGVAAFKKRSAQDYFYDGLRSLSSKLKLMREKHSQPHHQGKFCWVGIPLLVVEGNLFRADHCPTTGTLVPEPVDSVRLHWRGDEEKNIVSIDVVRLRALPAYAAKRARDTRLLLGSLKEACDHIAAFHRGECQLEVSSGPRGFQGRPALLAPQAKTTPDQGEAAASESQP